MTKKQLSKYTKNKAEIAILDGRITEAERDCDAVVDHAKDYSTGFGKPIVLRGFGSERIIGLREQRAKLRMECRDIEEFVNGIKNNRAWRIIRLLYIKGDKVSSVAKATGYSRTQMYRLINAALKDGTA